MQGASPGDETGGAGNPLPRGRDSNRGIDPGAPGRRPILLWDVMGTLVHDPFWEDVPAFFDISFETLIDEKHPTAWRDFEAGRIDEETFLGRFFRDRRQVDGEALKRRMEESYRWVPGMERILAALSAAGVAMYALSNYPPWYRLIERRLGLSRYLSWRFVSCETGVRKPDPEAYLGAARALGVAPGECVFVDDREINCEAARAVGMCALLFHEGRRLHVLVTHPDGHGAGQQAGGA